MISAFIQTNTDFAISSVLHSLVEVIVVLSLIVLLVIKELLRAYDGPRPKLWMRILDFAIAPLLLVFCLIVLLRFLRLLNIS